MLKSMNFLRGKSRGRVSGGTKAAPLVPVILCLVHRILLQQGTNLVNKLALLLHKCFFIVFCKFFKYPSPEAYASPSPSRGEGSGLLRCARNDGEEMHRPWCNKILSTRPSMTGARGADFVRLLRRYTPRNDAERTNIAFKGLDVVRQYAALLERRVQRGTRARKALVVTRQVNPLGRSMIEMLGVLAIIGVLSVGGIAGYSKAMEKYKVNKLVEEYTSLMFGLMEHMDNFSPLRVEGEYQERYYLAETIQGLNLVPAGWRKHGSGQGFIDSSGNMIYTYVRGNMITFDLQLGAIDGSGSYNIIQSFSNKLCFELFNNMLQPLHSSLFAAGIWKNKSAGVTYYGDKYCGAENKCLRAATLSDMHNLCNSCTIKKENCIVVWELDNT